MKGYDGAGLPYEEAEKAAERLSCDMPDSFMTPEKREKLTSLMSELGGAETMLANARLAQYRQQKFRDN